MFLGPMSQLTYVPQDTFLGSTRNISYIPRPDVPVDLCSSRYVPRFYEKHNLRFSAINITYVPRFLIEEHLSASCSAPPRPRLP
jgi:hypothetical protein